MLSAFYDRRGRSPSPTHRPSSESGAGKTDATKIFLHYLARCGFNAFQFEGDSALEAAADSLDDFSEHYQASIDQPLPLFRRRG